MRCIRGSLWPPGLQAGALPPQEPGPRRLAGECSTSRPPEGSASSALASRATALLRGRRADSSQHSGPPRPQPGAASRAATPTPRAAARSWALAKGEKQVDYKLERERVKSRQAAVLRPNLARPEPGRAGSRVKSGPAVSQALPLRRACLGAPASASGLGAKAKGACGGRSRCPREDPPGGGREGQSGESR